MKNSLKEIREELSSIRNQKLTPVTSVKLGSPIPTPETFRIKLDEILTEIQPSLLAIDYKETSAIPNRYSIEDYSALLKTACEICHTHNIKCTNGGLEDNALILYYLASLKNDSVEFKTILSRFGTEQRAFATQKQYEKERIAIVSTVEKLLTLYNNCPLDYINIIWSGYPGWLFEAIVRLIKEKTGTPVVSTEMEIPPDVKDGDSFLKYVRNMRLECVIWYFPFEDLRKAHLIDEDGNLTDIANSLRSANRSVF